MPCVYEFWPGAAMSVPETQSNQGFANRAPPVMYLSTANSGLPDIIIAGCSFRWMKLSSVSEA